MKGQTDPPGVNGLIASSVHPKPTVPVSVKIGGVDAEVLYYGAAPGAVAGTFQVNARIPEGAGSGEQMLVLTVGGWSSPQGVTVAVR